MTRDAGRVLALIVVPSLVEPVGRTITSPTLSARMLVKARLNVSVNTREPATNATPRTMAKALISSLSLRASKLFQLARNMAQAP